MISRFCLPLLFLGFSFFLVGQAALSRAEDEKGEKPVTLTEKDTGGSVKLTKGALLEVKLPSTAGTGYTWQIVKNNPEQLVLQGRSQIIRPDKKVVGGKQTQLFRFKAEWVGTSDLEIVYRRPFEKGKTPAKTFSVTVTIGMD
jgi:inhibitor of cysteine peptidase